MKTLKEILADWTDVDGAELELAVMLGFIEIGLYNDDNMQKVYLENKHIFWSNNPIGNFLGDMLEKLVELNVLEKRDEPDIQYRYNQNYKLEK